MSPLPSDAEELRASGWTVSTARLEGARVRYARAGRGAPVLLLHGWGSSGETLKPLALDLARSFEVACPDFPGHGGSGLPSGAWGVADFVGVTRELLDALGWERVDVVAHSFGGRVAAKLAAETPGRVGRLVLVAAAGLRPRRTLRYRVRTALLKLGKWLARLGGPPAERLRQRLVHSFASRDYLAAGPLRETFVRVVREDLSGDFRRISAPTLLVWGSEDRETPLEQGKRLAGLIPDSDLLVVEGAGHYVFADRFHQVRLAVRRFLEGDR